MRSSLPSLTGGVDLTDDIVECFKSGIDDIGVYAS
jgi:hypothetical protein